MFEWKEEGGILKAYNDIVTHISQNVCVSIIDSGT